MLTTETAAEKRLKRQLAELTDRLSRDVPPFSDSTMEASRDRHRLTRTDTDVFGRTYLPHYFENVSAAFHTDIDEMLGWATRHLFVVHGPREHAKSSTARARLLQRLLGGEIRYWLFCSEHLNLATRHLEAFKAELTDNRRIGTDYACNVLKWDETGGTLRVRVKVRATGKTHTFQLEAISYGRPAKGRLYMSRRPEGCLVDDFENTRTSRNERIGWEKLIWLEAGAIPRRHRPHPLARQHRARSQRDVPGDARSARRRRRRSQSLSTGRKRSGDRWGARRRDRSPRTVSNGLGRM